MEVAAIPLATDPTVEPSERPASPGGSFDLVLSTLAADLFAAPLASLHLGSPEGEPVEVARGEASLDADPAPDSSVVGGAPGPLPAESSLGDLPRSHLNLSPDDPVVASPAPLAAAPGDETTSAIRGGAAVRAKGDGVPVPAPQRVLGAAAIPAPPTSALPTGVESVGASGGPELPKGVEAATGPRGRGKTERLWAQWVRARVGRAHGGVPVPEGGGLKATTPDTDGDAAPSVGDEGRVSDPDLVASPTMIVGVPMQGGDVEDPPAGAVSDTPVPQESGVRVWPGSTTADEVSPGGRPVSEGSSPDATGPPPGSGATAAEPVLSEAVLPSSPASFGDAERVSRAGLVPSEPEPEGVPAQHTSPRPYETIDSAEVTVGKEAPTLDSGVDPSPDGRGEEPVHAAGGEPVAAPTPRPGRGNGRRVRPTHPAVSRAYPPHEPSARVQVPETVAGSEAPQGLGPPVSVDPSAWGDQGMPEEQRSGVSKVATPPGTRVPLSPEGSTASVSVRAVSATPIHVTEAPASPTAPEVSSPVVAAGGAEPAPPPPSFQHPGWAASNAHRLAHSIRVAWDRGRGELRMRLDPPHLGRVQVILRQGSDGMSAHLRVENIEAQHLLAESVATLREALGARGVPLADVSVTVDSGSGRQADSEAEIERRRRRGRRMGLEELAETGPADPLSTSPDGWTPWGFETRI